MKKELTKEQEVDRWVPQDITGMFVMNPKLTDREKKKNEELNELLKQQGQAKE
jgi:hypothetical protein